MILKKFFTFRTVILSLLLLVATYQYSLSGDVLIVNDNTTGNSAQLIFRALFDAGYVVDYVNFAGHDNTVYDNYSLVIWSAGDNTSLNIFNDASSRNALLQRIRAEKKVWVEGGGVGNAYGGVKDTIFRNLVLHIDSWVGDGAGAGLVFAVPNHPIFNTPNAVSTPIAFSNTGSGDRDIVHLIPNDVGRTKLGVWSQVNDSLYMSINAWTSSPHPITSLSMYTSFNFGSITDTNIAKQFAVNIGTYLLIPDNTPELILQEPRDNGFVPANAITPIRWIKNKVGLVKIEYKLRNEPEWTLLGDSIPAFLKDAEGNVHYEYDEKGNILGMFPWSVPDVDTAAYVRITDDETPTNLDENGMPFYITHKPIPVWAKRTSLINGESRPMSTYIKMADTGYVYVFGGGDNNGSVVNQQLNTVTGTWVKRDTLPFKASTGGAVTVKNKMYVIGGFSNINRTLDKVQIYTPSTNTWSQGTPMPSPVKADFGIGVWRDSLIYIAGGDSGINSGGIPINNVRIYNPSSNAWSDATPLPVAIAKFAMGIYHNTIIVVGGADRSQFINFDTVYVGAINPTNPSLINWSKSNRFPEGAIVRLSAGIVRDGIVFTGGDSGFSSNFRSNSYLCRIDTVHNKILSWFPLPDLAQRRSGMGPLLASNGVDSVWAVGGFFNGAQLSACEALNINLDSIRIQGVKGFDVAIPSAIILNQNYPNPFNPSTNISYTLKASGFVTMKVFNLLGEEVSTLVNEHRGAGDYKTTLNATGLTSGIYFYRLTIAGDNGKTFSETKKMVLLK